MAAVKHESRKKNMVDYSNHKEKTKLQGNRKLRYFVYGSNKNKFFLLETEVFHLLNTE